MLAQHDTLSSVNPRSSAKSAVAFPTRVPLCLCDSVIQEKPDCQLPLHSAKLIRFDLRPTMVREFSAGGVVLRKMRGRWFLAVIEPHMERPKKSTKQTNARRTAPTTIVALPKGTIDNG